MSDSDQVEWGLYQTLQEVLKEIGLPETHDRTHSGPTPGKSIHKATSPPAPPPTLHHQVVLLP